MLDIRLKPWNFFLDFPEGKNLEGENIYQKMKEADRQGIKISLKTSQPNPRNYFDAYKKQLEKFDKVLCLTLSSKVSGCYNSAEQAREMIDNNRVFVIDTKQGAAGQTLLVLRAIELIQEHFHRFHIFHQC
jgi:DegV family protein with EDD domain